MYRFQLCFRHLCDCCQFSAIKFHLAYLHESLRTRLDELIMHKVMFAMCVVFYNWEILWLWLQCNVLFVLF